MIRLVRWIVAAWATIWLFRVARHNRELMRVQLERIDELGRRATGYPNEWGVRTTPLTSEETAAALRAEEEFARAALEGHATDPAQGRAEAVAGLRAWMTSGRHG